MGGKPPLAPRPILCYPCQMMNLYREMLPADCPPPAAEEIVSPRLVYRLVDNDPPADADFQSQRAKNPGKIYQVSECRARGLSVYARLEDAKALAARLGLERSYFCRVALQPGAGRILKTGSLSHYTWWPWADFDILSHCQVTL